MTVYVDDMRAAYGRMVMCHMIADTEDKLHTMADKIGVAWKYRRQMPTDLVPSKDAVEATERGWVSQEVAGMTVMTPGAP